MTQPAAERLDSWKAIAAYLHRDQRTVRRWEDELGLPVHRLPGGRGRSVFAYRHEVDEWLRRDQRPPESRPAAPAATPEWRTNWRPLATVAAVATLVTAATMGWWRYSHAATQDLRVEMTAEGVVARTVEGDVLWRYAYPGDRMWSTMTGAPSTPAFVAGGLSPAIFAAVAAGLGRRDRQPVGGMVVELDGRGAERRTFVFHDTVTTRAGSFGPPWIIMSIALSDTPGRRWVAVAAHHAVWNASLVTVLDEEWRRRGTFVHDGWIESVHWLAPDRLLVGGFSNDRNGGMVALLDPTAPEGISGQGPVAPTSPGFCAACGATATRRVVVMPRSELNRATASPFNRARVQVYGNRVMARTIEVPEGATGSAADVIYEFDPALRLVRASYSDRYREVRSDAVATGHLHPPRGAAADAPPRIEVWESSSGWRTFSPP